MPIPGPPITTSSTVRFVDSIAASPTTRLDLNDGTSFITLRDGTTFDPPPLNQPTAAMPGVFDGAPPSASSYGNRVINLKLRLTATDENALTALVRALMVELNRETNFLMLQVAAAPVFFRTYRTSAEDVDFGDLGLGDCTITIPLLAEPFGYGVRVDVGPTTLTADPAVTNGCYIDVNGVTGDVPTPALINLKAGTGGGTGQPIFLAVRRHGTPASLGWFFQAESATLSGGATLAGSHDATASGAGNNYVNIGAAGQLVFTPASTAELAGTYRMLLRVQSGGSSTYHITTSGNATTTTHTTDNVSSWDYVDIGLIEFPDSQIGYSGVDSTLDATLSFFNIVVTRTAGAGTMPLDLVVLLPADEELTILGTDINVTGSHTVTLDGPNDTYYLQLTPSGRLMPWGTAANAARAGSIPSLQPGANRLFCIPGGYTITGTWATTVSYWPRYLTV